MGHIYQPMNLAYCCNPDQVNFQVEESWHFSEFTLCRLSIYQSIYLSIYLYYVWVICTVDVCNYNEFFLVRVPCFIGVCITTYFLVKKRCVCVCVIVIVCVCVCVCVTIKSLCVSFSHAFFFCSLSRLRLDALQGQSCEAMAQIFILPGPLLFLSSVSTFTSSPCRLELRD